MLKYKIIFIICIIFLINLMYHLLLNICLNTVKEINCLIQTFLIKLLIIETHNIIKI